MSFNLSDERLTHEDSYPAPHYLEPAVQKFIKELKDYIMCKVDLEDNDKQYHQIINEIDKLAGKYLI